MYATQRPASSTKSALPARRNSRSARRLLVVGDLICDIHHCGVGGGTSTEAPVPRGLHRSSAVSWGGAGLLARNCLALGDRVVFFSVLGDDAYGAKLKQFKHPLLEKRFLTDSRRHTTVKERFLIDGEKVLRWNRGTSLALSPKLEVVLLRAIIQALPRCDKVLISDYRHGVVSKSFAAKLIALARRHGKPIYVDSQVVQGKSNHRWYRGADLLCLNQKEAAAADPRFSEKKMKESLTQLQELLKTPNVVVKLGKRGSAALLRGEYALTPARKVNAVDAVGAGDAFFAALGACKEISKEALEFAAHWAALAVSVPGTEPPKFSMLKKLI